jgi:hypothetical protein
MGRFVRGVASCPTVPDGSRKGKVGKVYKGWVGCCLWISSSAFLKLQEQETVFVGIYERASYYVREIYSPQYCQTASYNGFEETPHHLRRHGQPGR